MFADVIPKLQQLGILLVVAAGNNGNSNPNNLWKMAYLDEYAPQYLGTEDNIMITVGGVGPDGRLDPISTRMKPGTSGSITVYAQSAGVKVATNWKGPPDGSERTTYLDGTSFAAPAVVSV